MRDDYFYLKLAYQVAAKYSTDPSTQNGAVLVDACGNILADAANCFPTGIKETRDRWERPLKYKYVEHAERNVLFSAAKRGISTRSAKMYVPWFACPDCARAIIQCGITEVIGHKKISDHAPERWEEAVHIGLSLLRESGVQYKLIDGNFGITILLDGKEWTA